MFQEWHLEHVAFKSFDGTHCNFLKRVCHQTIYDNWHIATCMKYYSVGSTESLKKLAQRVSHMLLNLNKHLLSTERCFVN